MQKWEYLTFREHGGVVKHINGQQASGFLATLGFGNGTRPYEMLNKLGQDGWELIGLSSDTANGLNYVFKRPLD